MRVTRMSNQQTTSQQPASNQPATTDKNVKNVKKENKKENLNKRKLFFEKEVMGFAGKFPQDMLKDFIRYWTEPNRSQTQMRCELEKTWSIAGRLATWHRNYLKSNPNPKGTNVSKDPLPDDYGTIRPGTMTREEWKQHQKQKANE